MKKVIINNNGNTVTLYKLFQDYNTQFIQSRILVIDSSGKEYRIISYYKQGTLIFALVNLDTKELSFYTWTCLTLDAFIQDLIHANFEVFFDYEG